MEEASGSRETSDEMLLTLRRDAMRNQTTLPATHAYALLQFDLFTHSIVQKRFKLVYKDK